MWIRSQSKSTLLRVNFVRIRDYEDEYLIIGVIDGCEYELGFYSSKEKALSVLDEIQRFIYHIDNLYATFQMPADDEVVE